jgi:hypothetical protein
MPAAVPIRGVLYPSVKVAAKALNVSVQAVYLARANGTLESCGLKPAKKIETVVDGVTYPSIQQAARSTGVSYSSLQRRNKRKEKVAMRQDTKQIATYLGEEMRVELSGTEMDGVVEDITVEEVFLREHPLDVNQLPKDLLSELRGLDVEWRNE